MTSLGIIHTAISLVAVASGAVSLIRYKKITPETQVGVLYIATTALVCLTGFGIFQHGGFGKAHVLGIITLAVLAIAGAARKYHAFGSISSYVEVVSYSLTFFFHMIPGVTETATRLPPGAHFVDGPDAPILRKIIGTLFVVFVVGAFLQVRRLHGESKASQLRAALSVAQL